MAATRSTSASVAHVRASDTSTMLPFGIADDIAALLFNIDATRASPSAAYACRPSGRAARPAIRISANVANDFFHISAAPARGIARVMNDAIRQRLLQLLEALVGDERVIQIELLQVLQRRRCARHRRRSARRCRAAASSASSAPSDWPARHRRRSCNRD